MSITDKDIHKGHRSRMRNKLELHGQRIFDTYELLEMLLYYVIPYKDTNPIAKRLLATFGTLDGVFSAPVKELAEVDGIGERCAEFLSNAGKVFKEDLALLFRHSARVFDNYYEVGEFLVSYFEENKTNVLMMMLDNGMRLIDVCSIPADDFGSAAVKPRYFVDAIISSGASIVILAHRRHSFLCFSESALATDKMLRSEFAKIGVTVAEHYVISGKKYSGYRPNFSLGSPENTPALDSFYKSVPDHLRGDCDE